MGRPQAGRSVAEGLARRCPRVGVPSVLALLIVSGCAASGAERALPASLTDRFSAGRLGGFTIYRECAPQRTPTATGNCESDRLAFNHALTADVALTARQSRDSSFDARRLRALLDLRWNGGDSSTLARATRDVIRLLDDSPRDASLWNALAVAELERGDAAGDFAAYLRALNAVSQSLKLDSSATPVRFNRALLLQRLHLNQSAWVAWNDVLARPDAAGWKREAKAAAAQLVTHDSATGWAHMLDAPQGAFDPTPVDVLVGTNVQAAREFSFPLLGAWGRAVLAGDGERATYYLQLCAAIGEAIARRGGDQGVARSANHLLRAREREQRARMARGYVLLAEGVRLHANGAYDDALKTLRSAREELRADAAPFWRWAQFYLASSHMNSGQFREATTLLRSLEHVDKRESALRGKAIWAEGVTELRQGHYEAAIERYDAARDDIVRSGETENLGALSYLRTEALRLGGQQALALAEAMDGMRLLSAFPASQYLNNHESNVASMARDAGLVFAAFEVANEVVLTSERVGRAPLLAWALRGRARDRIAMGDTASAMSDLARALREADSMQPGVGRERVRADVEYVLAQVLGNSRPDTSRVLLEKVVDAYRRLKLPNHLPGALASLARLVVVSGDTGRAIDLLRQSSSMIARQTKRIESPEARAAFVDAVDPVYDQLIQLNLATGRSRSALAAVLQSQARPWVGSDANENVNFTHTPTLDDARRKLAPDERLIDYVVLSDRLCIWVASRDGWSMWQAPIRRDSLAKLIARELRAVMTSESSGDSVEASLYEILIGSVRDRLEGAQRLVIVPDRELGELAFASLRDRVRDQYLVEQFELRQIPSVAFLLRGATPGVDGRALVIGDVRYVGGEHVTLPGAAKEAYAIAQLHHDVELLSQDDAAHDRVVKAFADVAIIHFAGHAITNRARPELSYLALSTTGAPSSSRLEAREIMTLKLSKVRVVVLSACSTQGAATRRGGMLPALAYSFLSAGVAATVSTMWDVNDRATLQLQGEFHQRLGAGERVSAALRNAQLDMLRSGDAELQHPSAWAGFVVNGA